MIYPNGLSLQTGQGPGFEILDPHLPQVFGLGPRVMKTGKGHLPLS
jgi:hypothetical protein